MNQLKNKLLMFIALSGITANLIPHGGGGSGFGAGLAGGMIGGMVVSGAMNSGNRSYDPAYYDYQERKYERIQNNREKDRINKEIDRHNRKIDRHHKELLKLDDNKRLDNKTLNARKAEHKSAIQRLEDKIKALERRLEDLF